MQFIFILKNFFFCYLSLNQNESLLENAKANAEANAEAKAKAKAKAEAKAS